MILRESKRDAETVLLHPEIYETISEDGVESFELPDGPIYLCGYTDDLVGCFVIHGDNKTTGWCHVQVLPQQRKHSEEFGRAVIEWAWGNTDLQKLIAQIPFAYPNVKDFALRMGFEIEGVNKKSIVKHGELMDQWYLGLSKWDS